MMDDAPWLGTDKVRIDYATKITPACAWSCGRRRVASVLEADPEDALVIDGYAGLDPLVISLRATELTTKALPEAKRAAQALRGVRG
jgi:hypothetical protein